MTSATGLPPTESRPDKPAFRVSLLLDAGYLRERLRSVRSPADLARRLGNVVVHLALETGNAYYELRGRLTRAYLRLTTEPLLKEPPLTSAERALAARVDLGTLERADDLAREFRDGIPFKHAVIDRFLLPEFCGRLLAEFPRYDPERFRNEHGHLGKAHFENLPELGPAYRQLDRTLRSKAFLDFMSQITGIPGLMYDPGYFGGGVHENLESMELDPHVDFTMHPKTGLFRRVNMLLYLNPDWDESWGGNLELHTDPWQPPDLDPVRRIAPLFNRCVVFETSDKSWHGFQPIKLPPGGKARSRRSIALYLYTKDDPRGIPVIPSDLTVFVDRPLPARFKAGYTLTQEDEKALSHLIVRRDWKLHYLYDRAIALFNETLGRDAFRWDWALQRLRDRLTGLFRDLRS